VSLESRRARAAKPTWLVIAIGLPVVFVIVLADGLWFDAGIVAVTGLALGLFYVWTAKMTRDVDEFPEELPNAPAGPPSEAALAIEAFNEAVIDARGVPLTDQVRLDRREVAVLLDRLRTALRSGPSESRWLLDQLEELFQRAKPIPLTDDVRLEREAVHDILDRLSASLAGETVRHD
jgi:hypothetical protein